jgi:acetyl esterase/lipase
MTSILLLATVAQTGFQQVRNVEYARVGTKSLQLDLSLPTSPGAKPLVIWIHGGGWQAGDKANWRPAQILQARHPEFAVASINYRLSGEAIHPAQTNDCKTAVAFLRANAAKFKLDPKKFAVWGSSAGGHLAAMVGTTNEWTLLGAQTNSLSRVAAVADYYGPTDLVALAKTPGYTSHALPTSPESRLLGGPVLESPAAAKLANPIAFVSKNDPPFYIVHGSADPVVAPNQRVLLEAALRAKGVPVTSEVLPGAGHGGTQFTEPALIDRIHAFFVASFARIGP